MNQVLYTLTVITPCIQPLQFITGIYGMNFVNIPELSWHLGYMYFWLLAFGVFCTILLIMRRRNFLAFIT